MALADLLDDPSRRVRLLDASEQLLEDEVASKRGLSGLAIKTGFAAMKAIRPGIVRAALEMLLPAFAPVIERHVGAGRAAGDVAGWFAGHADAIAEDLLAVTDAKARTASHPVLQRTYAGLRGQAHQHTAAAIPAVGRLLAAQGA